MIKEKVGHIYTHIMFVTLLIQYLNLLLFVYWKKLDIYILISCLLNLLISCIGNLDSFEKRKIQLKKPKHTFFFIHGMMYTFYYPMQQRSLIFFELN